MIYKNQKWAFVSGLVQGSAMGVFILGTMVRVFGLPVGGMIYFAWGYFIAAMFVTFILLPRRGKAGR